MMPRKTPESIIAEYIDPSPQDCSSEYIRMNDASPTMRSCMKRVVDIVLAAAILSITAPLLAVCAVLVWVTMGRPVIFRQKRPGRWGKAFTLYKLRTMRDEADSNGVIRPDAQRLTKVGALLRKTSLDELPELWNVLKGEMSLVGPRPLLPEYQPYFTRTERVRFEVLPGITGLAQINGRNHASWDERLQADIWYVANQSFILDVKILYKTVAAVVRCGDVVVDPRSVMLNLDEERKGRESTD
ncbi:sugar transferase [uncultured Paludibaculum sp.]|uniref:sugar transferase n=1 Tax=uncultured Paludibaculum sp. TaxID=1765020 RepID=UPI002AAB2937|nr:sugar transferase [uncultured Paludibaculum sp.]